MKLKPSGLLAALLAAGIVGCTTRTSAPVIDRLPPGSPVAAKPASAPPVRAVVSRAETYTVRRGDTLFSIALDHGQDYRELAQWNGIDNPNMIRADQVLRMTPPPAPKESAVQVRPITAPGSLESRPVPGQPLAAPKPLPAPPPVSVVKTEPRALKLPYSDENFARLSRDPNAVAAPSKPAPDVKPLAEPKPPAEPPKAAPQAPAKLTSDSEEAIDWGWPTAGRVSAGYSEATNKGLDIAGKTGQPVLASASGTVLYVGSGIRGYGKLLVIRHNKAYSTVYAHNDAILVKEGQRVVKGQKVAEMGNSDSEQVKLHFEIRRLGKPVDPVKFLPGR